MRVTVNGEEREFDRSLTVSQLLGELGIDARKVALECNLEIVPRSAYDGTEINDGDRLEVVHFIGGGSAAKENALSENTDRFIVAGRQFHSRLVVGTGKYKDFEETRQAIEISGADIVTVAVR